MKKDKTQLKNPIQKLQSLVLTIMAVVAPVLFIYSQFQSLQTIKTDLMLKKDALKQQELNKELRINCHTTTLETLKGDYKKNYSEEYEKCVNALGL